jgi:hypothetical protein
MAGGSGDQKRQAAIRRALGMAAEAMDLLDAHDGPAEAAAHFDLARQRLQEELAKSR